MAEKVVIGNAERRVWIYALCDPLTDAPRYVGKTVSSPLSRIREHKALARRSRRLPVQRWLNAVDGVKLSGAYMRILEVSDADTWASRERHWIAHGRAAGWDLFNLTDGGEGLHGLLHSDEHRRKNSEAHKRGPRLLATAARSFGASPMTSRPGMRSFAPARAATRGGRMAFEEVIIGNARLIHGDCREVLPLLPAVDAVITDPPYGMGLNTDWSGMASWSKNPRTWNAPVVGDGERFDPAHLLGLGRVQVLWGAQYFCHSLPERGGWMVFNKRGDGAPSEICFGDCELAWASDGQAVRLYSQMWHGVARWRTEGREHPTQKPIGLMAWCMDKVKVRAGETVLDPYMGSGSTGVAAMQTGRKFIGVEMVREYFDIACERISRAQAQGQMFAPEEQPNPIQDTLL